MGTTLFDRRSYPVDASRLSTVGYGQKKTVTANDSPIGRAENRRVELTKQ
jgi:outer membrane protein OmpA-like peptidoglycan-associated protein